MGTFSELYFSFWTPVEQPCTNDYPKTSPDLQEAEEEEGLLSFLGSSRTGQTHTVLLENTGELNAASCGAFKPKLVVNLRPTVRTHRVNASDCIYYVRVLDLNPPIGQVSPACGHVTQQKKDFSARFVSF